MNTVIVTRHTALVDFLREKGISGVVVSHATAKDVAGKIVYGVLPLHLASLCEKVVSVDLNIPSDKRGIELTLDDVRAYYTGMHTYVVKKVD